jgi:hypothetical protein
MDSLISYSEEFRRVRQFAVKLQLFRKKEVGQP